jgi:hypothetical protein
MTLASTLSPVKVSGHIAGLDPAVLEKNPIRVTLTSPTYMLPITTTANADGSFAFPEVFPGGYTAVASAGTPLGTQLPARVTVNESEISNLTIAFQKP